MSEGAPPRFSVVIVNFNGRRHLERCLPALEATTAGAAVETIVVDNGSADDSVAWLAASHPGVRVLPQPRNLGFGAANRVGIAAARAELVALLNSDTVPEPGWLEALAAPLETASDVAATCAVLRLLEHPDVLNARGGGMTWLGYGFDRGLKRPFPDLDELPDTEETLFPTAAAALFRRLELLRDGFDPAFFMYHEDVDLGWRLWLRGRRVLVCHRAVVAHAYGGTTLTAQSQRWRERLGSRHNVRTMLKCYEPLSLARSLKNLAVLWIRQRAWGHLVRVTAWNLAHITGTLRERRHIQRTREISDRELRRRGLIDEAPAPPPTPVLPYAADPRAASAGWVRTPTLLPVEDSARGRLGAGWYSPEEGSGGERQRWTCPAARCFLRVDPEVIGHLEVELKTSPAVAGKDVVIVVNGARGSCPVAEEDWTVVSLPAAADGNGLLSVDLRSPAWVPHHARGNWDFRELGCAVRRLSFVSDHAAVSASPRTVSVVIPTFNRAAALLRTLEALAVQTVPPLEVVVVDDGSTDGTWEKLGAWRDSNRERLLVSAYRQENAGPGSARNLGVAHTGGDLVAFLGDDTFPEPTFVASHLARHAALGEPCAVVGLTEWDHGAMNVTPFLEHVNRNGEQFAYGRMSDGADIPFNCFYTSNVSLPRDLALSEPFDSAFPFAAWEDAELGYRLSLRGMRIVYSSEPRTRHAHPMTMAGFLRRQRRVGASVHVLFHLHPELEGEPGMPGTRAPWWFSILGPLAAPVTRVLSALDQRGVRLPVSLYRLAILSAYFAGLRDARRARGTSARAATMAPAGGEGGAG